MLFALKNEICLCKWKKATLLSNLKFFEMCSAAARIWQFSQLSNQEKVEIINIIFKSYHVSKRRNTYKNKRKTWIMINWLWCFKVKDVKNNRYLQKKFFERKMGEPLKKWYIFTEWIIRGLNVDISIISLFENPIVVLLILCIAWQNWNSTLVFRLRADNKIQN